MKNNKKNSAAAETECFYSLYQKFGNHIIYEKLEIGSINIDGRWQNFDTAFNGRWFLLCKTGRKTN